MTICDNSEICFFGDYPTLAEVKVSYGSNAPVMWLIPQLYNLSEYCGCKEKLQGAPLEECASVIATYFYYLKVSEFMLFFHRFKSGIYGRFYGSIDPLIITTSLRAFLKERLFAYERREQEQRDRQREEDRKNAATWEEYCMIRYGSIKPRPPESERQASQQDDTSKIVKYAQFILSDPVIDRQTRSVYENQFKKKYGLTPKEYIKKHGNHQDKQ